MLRDTFSDGIRIERCLAEYDLPEAMLNLIVAIYGLSDHEFKEAAYREVVSSLRLKCDYSLMTANIACLYAALLDVLYENPLSKIYPMIDLVNMFRDTGFRSRVSNMMALALLNEGEDFDAEDRSSNTLKLYHAIHQKHGFITGEDDYLAAMYMAGKGLAVEDMVDKIEAYYHALASHSFAKGNALQALAHQIILLGSQDQEALVGVIDAWHRSFKKHHIKTNSSQILVYGLLAAFDFDQEIFASKIGQVISDAGEKNPDHKVHALERTTLMLREMKWTLGTSLEDMPREQKSYIKASLLLLMTSYLFRERLI